MNMGILLLLFFTTAAPSDAAFAKQQPCNVYRGEWLYDDSYPLFDSSKCTFIRREFSCLKNGRPDHEYLKYRWQPTECSLPKFDGVDFLRRLKGKKVLFVGDSVSDNQWQSLVCLLEAAVGKPGAASPDNSIPTVTFQSYQVSISMFLSHYLVDVENRTTGRVLNLNSIKDGETWKQYDVIIFNTWLWWYRTGPKQPWDYIEYDRRIVKDMDRMIAFRKGLTTWARWVNSGAVKPTTKVFFQGISPMHYRGAEWNKPEATNCSNETTPLMGSMYPSGEPFALKVLKEVLNTKLSPSKVHLLDITTLSQLRKDGHPGKYGSFPMDCTHWCIAGVIDAWNQILYAQLVQES